MSRHGGAPSMIHGYAPHMDEFRIWSGDGLQRRLHLSYEHHMLKAERMRLGDWEIVAHYGKAKNEDRAIHEDVALMDVSWLTLLQATGPDRASALDHLLTSRVLDMREGQQRRALALDGEGKVRADMEVIALAERSLLVAPPTLPADRLAAALNRELLSEDVTFTDVGDRFAAFAVMGENSGWLLRQLEVPAIGVMGGIHSARVAGHPAMVFRCSFLGHAVVIMVREEIAGTVWRTLLEAVRGLSGVPVGFEAFNSWRIENGVPWFLWDLTEEVSPYEVGLGHAIAFEDHDYFIGRERARWLAMEEGTTRMLCGLMIDGEDLPPRGASIRYGDGMQAGRMLSSAFSRFLNKNIGLALIKAGSSRTRSQLLVEWDDRSADAHVVALPFPSARSAEGDHRF